MKVGKKMKNTVLQQAKRNKNNEYFTRYEDIVKFMEGTILEQQPEFFKDKIVVNFASKVDSNFWEYFNNNFHRLQLKGVVRTQYTPEADYTYAEVRTRKISTTIRWTGTGSMWEADYYIQLKELQSAGNKIILVDNPPFSNSHATKDFLEHSGMEFITIQSTTFRTGFWPFTKELKCFVGPEWYIKEDGTQTRVKTNWWVNARGIEKTRPLPTWELGYWNKKVVRFIDVVPAVRKEKGVLWGVPITWEMYDTTGWKTHACIKPKPLDGGRAKFERIIVEWVGGE